MLTWERFATLVTAKWSWLIALVLLLGASALIGAAGESADAGASPVPIPASAEAARAAAAERDFPGGGNAPVILVMSRADGATLTPNDLAAADAARLRVLAAAEAPAGPPMTPSQDGAATIAIIPIDSSLTGFTLGDQITALRSAATQEAPPQLTLRVTGGPAFGADIANSFSGANVTLLAVTGAVVALLLILTYRSPTLWLVPLVIIALADRSATVLGGVLTTVTGLGGDGSTTGITSVLVFGAGANYALLLISRYREELRKTPDHRAALRYAVSHAGPAIVASNATVVLALLTLLLAVVPSTRSLGAQAAGGLLLAALFVLVTLPPLLALFGPRIFWPFIPRPSQHAAEEFGAWYRVADWVSRHAGRVAAASIVLLAVLATGVLATPTGLSQTDRFRVKAESVSAYETLAAHYPAGLSDPTRIIGSAEHADDLRAALTDVPRVVSVTPAGTSKDAARVSFSVVIDAPPASQSAFDTINALRTSARAVDSTALVGGSDAQALDARDAARRDQLVVIPAILAVALAVLYVLLRAALAPLVLAAATTLSALAALGLGGWLGVHLFGFPALDDTTPLYALLFLIALGVDYTIFLVTRAREEAVIYGTRRGIVRAVSATGAVITSGGVVLAAVFAVLGLLPLIVLTQVGIIVGLGILLDTFVVRTVVIPALFTLIGPRIWWPARIDPVGADGRRRPT